MAITTKPRLRILLCSAALLGASACTAAFLDTAAHGIFTQEETNMTARSYAAADYLTQQASAYVGRNHLIVAEPLADLEQPGMSSDLSKMIPDQIGTRLAQLGYKMDLSNVASTGDSNYLKPAMNSGSPAFVLGGTYLRRRIEMDVKMRITNAKTGQVVASYDYVMPLTREINDMATPTPKIVRVTDQ